MSGQLYDHCLICGAKLPESDMEDAFCSDEHEQEYDRKAQGT